MKLPQRLLSVLLTVGLLVSLFAGLSMTAFAEEAVSLSFSGAAVEALSGIPGQVKTLPAVEATEDGYVFLGWTSTETAKTQTAPEYFPGGSRYTLPAEDTTLYALYTFVDGRGTPSIDRYEKISTLDELKDGSYLIGTKQNNKLRAFDGSSENPNASGNYKDLTFAGSDFVACSAESDACAVKVFKIENSDAYGIQMKNGTGKYIGSTGKTGMNSRSTEPYPLNVEFDENGIVIYVVATDKDNTHYNLSYYETSSTQKIGFYNNKQMTSVDLYRKIDGIDGTLYYTGEQISCDHEGTEGVETAPTCTADGFTTYLCPNCGYKWIMEGEEATGHDYAETVVEPTAYEGGYTLHTCSICGDSYQDNLKDPLGEDYDIEYVVLGETWKTDTINSYRGTDLPTPDVLPDGYEFAGWSTFTYKDETDEATLIKEDAESGKFHPFYNYTLYAVYQRGEKVTGSGDYVKVTEMPDDGLSGQFLVVCEDSNIAFNSAFATTATNLNKAGNYLSVAIAGDTIAATADLDAASVKIAPVGTTGNYSMKINSGLSIGSTGSSTANGINGDTKKTYQNDISFNSDGTAVIANAAETNTNGASGTTYNFTYNSSSVNRFAYCKPTTSTVHKSSLYQKEEDSFHYFYTTAPSTAGCEHEESVPYFTEPTCTAQGYVTNVCVNCGYSWQDDFEEPLGHDFDEGVVIDPTPTAFGYTLYTCQREGCNYTEQRDPTGYIFEIRYNILGAEQEAVEADALNGIDLPATATAVEGYKFIGWSEEEITEEAGAAEVLNGNFKPTEDSVLFAVYAREEDNEGSGDYEKVTGYPLVTNGNYLIVDEDKGIAFKAFEEDNEDYDLTKANNYISVSISGNRIEESELADMSSIVISPIEGTATYSMTAAESTDGKTHYIGTTGSSTGIMENTKNQYPVTIAFDEDTGNAVICNVNGNPYQLAYNTQSTSDKFGFFAASSKTADPIALYWKNDTGVSVWFTTRPQISCEHANTEVVAASEPNCTEPGYTAGVYCNDCQTYISGHETIEKLPHNYIEDERSEATCNQDGFITWICSACGDTYEEVFPATGIHSYNENGVCADCGYKLIAIESACLKLDADIDVIYTAKVPEGATATMTFTMNGTSVTVEDDGTHEFAFAGVNPQCMGDNISATLTVVLDDTTYTCTKAEYSVRAYCINKLADPETPEILRTLIFDTLAYGAAAQTYAGYKTDALVTKGIDNLSESTFEALSELRPDFNGEAAEDICWISAGLSLTNSVAMNFRFYAEDITDLSIVVGINGRAQTFTKFTAVEGKENIYEISFRDIRADEFADVVTASFFRGNENVGNTVFYSVNAYISAKQNDSDANLAELVRALYNYGASAAAYAK